MIIIILLACFSHQYWLMDFHRSSSDNKSLQAFRTLWSICLTGLNSSSDFQLFQPSLPRFWGQFHAGQ